MTKEIFYWIEIRIICDGKYNFIFTFFILFSTSVETIRNTPKGKRYYNVIKYLNEQGLKCDNIMNEKEIKCSKIEEIEKEKKINICYARVSSVGQKDDLERQKKLLKEKYSDYYLLEDIGSGDESNEKRIIKNNRFRNKWENKRISDSA